jgi:UDP-N-acetylglucosamine acyltransferase
MAIHPTAVIESGAEIGANVTVGAFAFIDAQTNIGDGCVIGPNSTILRYTTLGANCRVHAGAVVGGVPQDFSFEECESFVRIGANTVIRETATVNRGTKPGTATEIGPDCLLMAAAHVAHNCRLGQGVVLANSAILGGYAEIGDRSFVSANCLIHQFTRVGRLVMMAGASVVSKDVPPFCMTHRRQANALAGLNIVGMRRLGFSGEERLNIKRAFDTLFRSSLGTSIAAKELERDSDSPLVRELAGFISASERGVCAMARPVGK